MVLGARLRHRALVAGVLRAFVGVHEVRHVPGFLVAQQAGLAQRHIGLDEAGRVADLVHARAPVERVLAPQRGEDPVPAVFLPLAFGAVADGAILRVGGLAAQVVGFLRRRRQLAIAPARQLDAGRGLARQPVHVRLQGDQRGVVGRRGFAIHAVAKTALQALGQRVDVPVLGPVGRIQHVGRPHGRGIGAPARVQVAAGAGQVVADELGGALRGMQEDLLSLAHHFAELVIGNGVGRGRRERGRGVGGQGWRGRQGGGQQRGQRKAVDQCVLHLAASGRGAAACLGRLA